MIRIWSLLAPLKQQDGPGSIRNDRLPPELWVVVFNLLLDEIRHPFRHCTPKTFPQFQSRFVLLDMIANDPTLQDWKNIRLVCRTWRHLAGPQPHIHLRTTPSETSIDGFKGTSSILVDSNVDHVEFMEVLLRDRNSGFSHCLTTVAFSRNFPDDYLKQLLDNPSTFPSLRCLALYSTGDISSFWDAIQTRYPKLVALTIGGYLPNHGYHLGHFTLPNLQILNITTWNDFQLTCPSLKHFSIRHGVTPNVHQFLLEHGHQLESILFDSNPHTNLENALPGFWTIFPNIETLGIHLGSFCLQPPVGHPLRHLRLFSYRNAMRASLILDRLAVFQIVESVHIRPADMQSGEILHLQAQCLERNIEFVKMTELSNRQPSVISEIATGLLVAVTCPLWAPVVLCLGLLDNAKIR